MERYSSFETARSSQFPQWWPPSGDQHTRCHEKAAIWPQSNPLDAAADSRSGATCVSGLDDHDGQRKDWRVALLRTRWIWNGEPEPLKRRDAISIHIPVQIWCCGCEYWN